MQLSEQGRNLIKGFEGLMLTAYPDGNGYSIGYGHFGAKQGDTIDRAEADRLFAQDVSRFEFGVSSLLARATTQSQFDALVSLAYNIGTGGFGESTVLRLHNVGDFGGAADAFRMWNKSKGAVHQGLVARREKERAVYLQGFAPYAIPNFSPVEQVPPPVAFPAAESTPGLLAVGLLFFCPSCGHRSGSVGVEVTS